MNAPPRKRVCHILHLADGGRLLIMAIRKPRPSRLLLRLVRRAQSWIAASIGVLASVFFAGAQAQVAPTALPTDGRVVSGQAAVSQAGARMDISQSSAKAILNWGSFNIGAQAQVNFAQPGRTAVALNRVLSGDPSQIYGKLSANGQVFLLNPNGVLFGPSARVDVGGMVASTLAIKDSDFLAGNYRFTRDGATGTIVNQGTLTAAEGGYVALLSPEVRNQGVIQATLGTVALAGGDALTLKFNADAPLSVAVDPATVESLIENQNLVRADGGTVIMSAKAADELAGAVIQAGGLIAADSLQARNGQIVLDAGNNGAIEISGALSAQGIGTGGRIDLAAGTLNNRGELSARDITLTGNDILQQGRIAAPGGSVTMAAHDTTYLDGVVDVSDAQGTGGRIWLTTTTLEGMKGGSLRADGQQGGRIYVQGSGMVGFSSTFSATGTTQGGSIEVTGDEVYLLNADVDASGGDKGGIVHLGGGWQGSGELPHAREVLVGVGSQVKANGAPTGVGGEVVVWSSQSSEHYGSLQATDGGRIELSSQGEMRQTGDLQAGPGGSVLFDPKNLIITDTPPDALTLARKVVSGSVPKVQTAAVGYRVGASFGNSTALDGDRLAVGAVNTVHLFNGVGSDFSGVTWQKRLASGSGATGMPALLVDTYFGESLALDGDRLAVGDPGYGARPSAVHLFNGVGSDFSGLTWQRALASGSDVPGMPLLRADSVFGYSVALDGDRLAVGEPGGSGANPSAVHLFNGVGSDFSGLTWQRALTSGSGATGMPVLLVDATFGRSVALDGDRLAVGKPGTATSPIEVHLFNGVGSDFSGLTWQRALTAGSGATGMPALLVDTYFGQSLALDGDRLAVGAPTYSGAAPGAVHLFNGVGADFSGLTWKKVSTDPTEPDLANEDNFGNAVALDGDRLAVGAPLADSGGTARGEVHLFTGVGTDYAALTWQKKLASGTGATFVPGLPDGSHFGFSVALDGNLLAVGANFEDATTNNDNRGAVHLFTGVGADFSTLTWKKRLTSGAGASGMPVLADGAGFGEAVALDDDRLAVGAFRADAVHLFSGVGSDFSGLTWRKELASGAGAVGMPSFAAGDGFGHAVALDGDRLVVGAPFADSFNGAVYLLTGVGSDFAGLTWRNTLSSVGGAFGMPASSGNDAFGGAVALNGDVLAIGASHDDTGGTDRGAVHLFTGVGADFSALAWSKKLGSGLGAIGTPALANTDLFGSSIALDGDRMAIGAVQDDAGGSNRGAVYLFTGVSTIGLSTIDVSGARFEANPSATSYITPTTLTTLLNTGTEVTLQANNDITVLSAVIANNPSGNGGNLSLHAGHNISFNANVATDNGSLTAVAGDPGANPAYSDFSGAPVLTIANGASLKVGTGIATLAALGGGFFNYAGDEAILTTGAGRWLVYTTDPRTSIEGFSSYNKHYNQPYTPGSPPAYAASGNWFLYSVAPTLSVTPGAQKITYGDATPTAFTPSVNYSDSIDGDNAATIGLSGTASWAVAGPVSTSGHLTAGTHDVSYTGGLASSLGYLFVDHGANPPELAVDDKPLTAVYTGANKTYDRTVVASVTGASPDIVTDDAVGFDQIAAFRDKNVGVAKPVDVSGISLIGADAGNYMLTNANASTSADITAKGLTASYSASNKVYDGTTAATVTGNSGDIIGGDAVSFSQNAAFVDKNVGVAKTVNVTDIALLGADAANYLLLNPSAIATADIIAKALGVTARYSASNKVYDGTTAATVIGSSADIIAGDLVSFRQNAAFIDKNVGVAKTVNVTDIALLGADAANYALVNTSAITTADIIAKVLTITAYDHRVRYSGRPYSGGNGVSYAGFVSGEDSQVLTGTLVYGGTAQGAIVPATYTISPSGLTAENYVISYADGTLFLEPQESVSEPPPETRQPPPSPSDSSPAFPSETPPVESYPSGTDVGESPIPGPGEGESEGSGEGGATAGEGSEVGDRLAAMAYVEAARHQARTELYKDALDAIRQDSTIADVPECDEDKSQEREELCIPKVAAAENEPANAQAPSEPKAGLSALEPEHKVALLFGNNAYKGRIRRLDTPIRDMNAIGKVLRSSMGYEVKVVENATKRDMIEELVALSKRVARDDSVLVMYAGHGYEMNDTKQGFWLPVDASASDAKSWVSNNDIYKLLKVIPAKQIILISDSCFSGTLTKEQKLGAIGTKKDILGRRSVVAMSSGDETPVADVGLEKHSIFAYHLIKQLGGTVTEQVASQLLDTMRAEVRKFFPQVPQIGGVISAGHVIGGDYLFLPKEEQTQAIQRND